MKWYWARVWFRSQSYPKARKRNLWEKTVYLVRADSELDAFSRGEEVGRRDAHEYEVRRGQRLIWEFVKVEEVQEILADEISDGVEVYHEFVDRVDKFE